MSMQRIKKRVADISFIIIVGFVCFVLLCTARGERPHFLYYEVHRVETSRMQPIIQDNECIIIEQVNKNDIKVGDIITFLSKDKNNYGVFDTSRVIDIFESKGKTWYTTKGDENEDNELVHVAFEDVEGKYCKNLFLGKFLGNCINILEGNNLYLMILLFPFFAFVISYAFGIFKAVYGNKDNKKMDNDEDDIYENEESLDDVELEDVEETEDNKEVVDNEEVEDNEEFEDDEKNIDDATIEESFEEDKEYIDDNVKEEYDELSEVRSEISQTMIKLEQMRVEAREKRKQAEKLRAQLSKDSGDESISNH